MTTPAIGMRINFMTTSRSYGMGKGRVRNAQSDNAVLDYVARWVLSQFFSPKVCNSIALTISIGRMRHNPRAAASVDCNVYMRDRATFRIQVAEHIDLNQKVISLAHEMVHVKQMLAGELTAKNNSVYWHGTDVTNVPYRSQPHEVEAYDRQEVLAFGAVRAMSEKGVDTIIDARLGSRGL